MTEKNFESYVKKWLNSREIYAAGALCHKAGATNGWFFKVWGGGYQKAGIPDLLICVKGIFLAVELKSPTGTLSELQKLNITRINEAGGIGIVLYPDGFNDFKRIIEGVLQCSSHLAALNSLKAVHSNSNFLILMG